MRGSRANGYAIADGLSYKGRQAAAYVPPAAALVTAPTGSRITTGGTSSTTDTAKFCPKCGAAVE